MALIKTYNPDTGKYEAPKHVVWSPAEIQRRIESLEAKFKALSKYMPSDELHKALKQ